MNSSSCLPFVSLSALGTDELGFPAVELPVSVQAGPNILSYHWIIFIFVYFIADMKYMFKTHQQCCGTVTIFYGSGSDFWQVPVPVPAPYLDHKKQFLKNLEICYSKNK
jgi:hypothetical protein